jgi:hypothetical protein
MYTSISDSSSRVIILSLQIRFQQKKAPLKNEALRFCEN